MKNSDFCLLVANMYVCSMAESFWLKVIFMVVWFGLGLFCLIRGE